MNFKKVGLIISREFSIRVKKKSFIITTIVTPILFAALMIVPSLIMMLDLNDDVNKVLVVDHSGVIASDLKDSDVIKYIISENKDESYLKGRLDSLEVNALLTISSLDEKNNVSMNAYSPRQLNASITSAITEDVGVIMEEYKLSKYNIDNFEQILKDVKTEIPMNTYILSEGGEEKKASLGISMGISFVMGFVIYMFVAMFGNMVMSSVINEKSNKIIEVIVSSVKPLELMLGKIVGVACVALTQFFIWIVLTFAIVVGASSLMGGDMLSDPAMTEQVASVVGMDASSLIGADAGDAMAKSKVMDTFNTIKSVNWGYIIGCFLIYFVLGYLLYASMFAAVGSAVDNEADTSQLLIPVTIPLMIGFFIMLQAFQNPDSQLTFWASMIPFTSPMVMLARVPFEGGVPTWELLLSVGLLIVTIMAVAYVAGKIYRVGILMSGTKYSWKDIMKWIKY